MSIEKEVAFDPYHKWLGIPKAQRPPTHYQILGLAQGETDAEVIEEAAIRQTTHLRAYQVGPHADDCTKLLNEVSAARQILVNPQKRQDYDSKLAQFAAKQAAAQPGNGAAKPAVAAPIVESAFADLSDGDDVPAGGSRRDLAKSARPHKPAKRPAPKAEPIGFSQTMILAAAGGVGLLIVGLVAIVAFFVSPPPPPPIPAPMANNNPKVAPPVVVNPQPNVPGVDPKLLVNPVPNPKDPLAGVTGFPPLGAFTLRSTPKNLIALADGRVFFGESNLNAYDPGSSRGLPFLSFPNPGPRGIRFALTPDGKQVCIGTPDAGKLVLHKLYGAQIASLKSPGEISAMAISPDGTTLVTGLFNGHVRIWDMATLVGVDMPQFHGPRSVESVVFSRDGSLVATASEKLILIWSARDKKLVVGVGIGQVPTSMAFTPDGKKLLAASAAGLQSTPLNNPRWTPVKPGRDGILHVAFVNDTTLAALRPEGPELYEWPTMTLLRQTLVGTRDCDTMALSPDGKVLFVGLTVPRLLAFGTEIDAVLKPYVSGTQKQGPPPTGSG
ncbi:MAG TPA: hypothetical protein VHR72_13890, partial [Gemmataceae bacterium]|nr:hypothetical protein [Gemmataceae bacterium]